METLVKNLSLGLLLRSGFAGVFFILAYQLTIHGPTGLEPREDPKFLSVVIPVAFFVGLTVYALHRAFTYPVIEYFMDRKWTKWLRSCSWPWGLVPFSLISDATADSLKRAWALAAEDGKKEQVFATNLTGWADWAHFHYVSSLCIVLGIEVGKRFPPKDHPPTTCGDCDYLWYTAVAFLLAGLTSDWRNKRVRERIEEDERAK